MAVLMLGIMILGLGCAPKFAWVGKWTGNRNLPVKPGDNPAIVHTIGQVELTFEPSGKFVLVEGGVPKTGYATLSDKEARLKIETFMGKPIAQVGGREQLEQPVIVSVQKDGTLSLVDPAGFDTRPIVLKRTTSNP